MTEKVTLFIRSRKKKVENYETFLDPIKFQAYQNSFLIETDPHTSAQFMFSYIKDVVLWCDENINGCYSVDQNIFYFQNSSDMTAFKLRWHNVEVERGVL